MTFEKIDLGQAGVSYVAERLSHNRALSRFILQELDLSKGSTFTFFPRDANVPKEELVQFNLDSDELGPSESAEHLCAVLHKFLAEDAGRICIFEDMFLEKNAPSLKKIKLPLFFYDSEVYYFLLSPEASLSSIEQLMLASNSGIDTVYVVSKYSSEHPVCQWCDVTSSTLRELAKRAEAVVVSAYDGGGYLVWLKERNTTFGSDGESQS